MNLEEFESKVEEAYKRAEEVLNSFLKDLEKLLADARERLDKGLPLSQEQINRLKELRAEARLTALKARAVFRDAVREARMQLHKSVSSLPPEERREVREEARTIVADYEVRLRERLEEWREAVKRELREARLAIRRLPRRAKPEVNIMTMAIGTATEALRRAEEALRRFTPTTVVSSIRLPERDLEVIDMLVEAGIFRSRSEAVAYFTHRGIEASKEWLEQVKGKVEELRKLREEVRMSLEELD